MRVDSACLQTQLLLLQHHGRGGWRLHGPSWLVAAAGVVEAVAADDAEWEAET